MHKRTQNLNKLLLKILFVFGEDFFLRSWCVCTACMCHVATHPSSAFARVVIDTLCVCVRVCVCACEYLCVSALA